MTSPLMPASRRGPSVAGVVLGSLLIGLGLVGGPIAQAAARAEWKRPVAEAPVHHCGESTQITLEPGDRIGVWELQPCFMCSWGGTYSVLDPQGRPVLRDDVRPTQPVVDRYELVFTFTASVGGTYSVSCSKYGDMPSFTFKLASPVRSDKLMPWRALGYVVAGGGVGLMVWTLVRRAMWRRQQASLAGGWPPPAGQRGAPLAGPLPSSPPGRHGPGWW